MDEQVTLAGLEQSALEAARVLLIEIETRTRRIEPEAAAGFGQALTAVTGLLTLIEMARREGD